MKYHPDKCKKNKEKQKLFQNILNAYNVLVKKDNVKLTESAEENLIGEFKDNEWGYFSWWRDNYQ